MLQTWNFTLVTCNLKPLAFPQIATFNQFLLHYSNLTFLTLMEKSCFQYQRFLKDYWIRSTPFLTRNCNCSAAEVQEKCLFVYLLSGEYSFAYGQWPNVFHLRFKSVEWAGNFVVCLTEVSLTIISFGRLFRLPVENFGRQRVNCRCLWCPHVMEQPCSLLVENCSFLVW